MYISILCSSTLSATTPDVIPLTCRTHSRAHAPLCLFQTAMASSLAMCRLHVMGRSSLVKCLQNAETFFHRSIGTNIAAQVETSRKEDIGKKTLLSNKTSLPKARSYSSSTSASS